MFRRYEFYSIYNVRTKGQKAFKNSTLQDDPRKRECLIKIIGQNGNNNHRNIKEVKSLQNISHKHNTTR